MQSQTSNYLIVFDFFTFFCLLAVYLSRPTVVSEGDSAYDNGNFYVIFKISISLLFI